MRQTFLMCLGNVKSFINEAYAIFCWQDDITNVGLLCVVRTIRSRHQWPHRSLKLVWKSTFFLSEFALYSNLLFLPLNDSYACGSRTGSFYIPSSFLYQNCSVLCNLAISSEKYSVLTLCLNTRA